MHLLAVSVALTVLTFVQAPGRIAPDTKADLSIDPVGFLLRAWHLWDALGDSGQLQNQAYGYFIPMGPFYAVGHILGFPAWMVQRAWWALVLLVAFHGMYRLCERFGVGNHPVRIIAGLAFALSSRMITEVGAVSIEVWPMAMAPWVLLPLIRVQPGGELKAAARSGLAVALCGGVNAVAVGSVLPLPFWWLVTREKGPVRRRLSGWWALCTLLGIFWWLGPLVLLGKYSPPFLDWVESSAVSTSKASLPSAFRGTTQWVAWFKLPEPIWLAGWSVLSSPVGIVLGWLLITISVLGITRKDTPNRRFLIGAGLGGLLLLTLGHVGPLTAPWAPSVQHFLDGAGAPLRNTHKFDVILRVPLCLGLAHALTRIKLPAFAFPGLPWVPSGPRALQWVAAFALVGSAAPALVGQLPSVGVFTKVPDAWRQAAAWLQQNDDGARTLIVPGSSFPTSIWGDPHDEPFQALARTEWATRSSVPLSSAGNIRMLNTIEAQLETGRGSPALAQFLSRAGISRILLRSDLVRSFQAGSPPLPVVVRSALEDSPGLHPVVRFGPDISGLNDLKTFRTVADDGLDVPQAQIEIWQVDSGARPVDVYPQQDTVKVAGGPESLLTLEESGRLGNQPTVLDGDPDSTALENALSKAPQVDTDTVQKREATFSQVRDNYSDVMTPAQAYTQPRAAHDWLPFDAPEVTAQYLGVSGVTASGSAGASTDAWHAFDGDPTTAWTGTGGSVGSWIQVTFPQAISLPPTIQLTPDPSGAQLEQVEVTTDRGSQLSPISQDQNLQETPQPVNVPGGATRSLRITVTKVRSLNDEFTPASIGEIALPGIAAVRELVLPDQGGTGAPEDIALENARDGTDDCMFTNGDAICSPRLSQQSEDTDLDRVAQLPAGGAYTVEATARVKATSAAYGLLQPAGSMTAVASSDWAGDEALRPGAAVDRDPGTAWMASTTDPRPTLTLSWPQARTVDKLRWQMDPKLAASKPGQLTIVANGRKQVVTPDADGWVRFPAVDTRQLQVEVTGIIGLATQDRASGFTTLMPVGVSEIVIPGADTFRKSMPSAQTVSLPCGQGPALVVGDSIIRTRVTGTAEEVLHRDPMQVEACDPVPDLAAGSVRLSLRATGLLEPQQLVFHLKSAPAMAPPATTAPVAYVQESPEHRSVTVNPEGYAQVVNVHENYNLGWKATLDGKTLSAVRLDGWQQGWVVPAGAGGTINLTFAPGTPYRATLIVGLLLILLLVGLAFPGRRGRRRLRRAVLRHGGPVELAEATSGRGYGPVGVLAAVAFGGFWVLGALVAVAVAFRWVALRWTVIAAGVVAGLGAALSINADESGFFAYLSIGAALVLVAGLVLDLDRAGNGRLTRWLREPGDRDGDPDGDPDGDLSGDADDAPTRPDGGVDAT
jgi:arabinofuranan 3-O-arabinosyltransferase